MRALEEAVVERQLGHLPRGRVDQFLPAVADVDAPQPRHAVEHLVVVRIVDVDAFTARNDARAFRGECLAVGERVQVVRGVGALPLFE